MFGSIGRPTIRTLAITSLFAVMMGPAAGAQDAFLGVTGWANPPVGHVAFCRAFPGECVASGRADPVALSAARWQALATVNSLVNRSVRPATDLEVYNSDEVWTLPGSAGDCEDYVLLKRKRLIAQGWPTGALAVAVVFDEVGDGHAVLLVRTDAGDFVLDNKTDEIRLWNETGYVYVKRQSDTDPRRWVSLGHSGMPSRSTAAPH